MLALSNQNTTKSLCQWYALYTHVNHERKVAALLESKRYEFFFPNRVVIHHWSDRSKKISEPLFPGYIFVRCDERNRSEVLQTSGALYLVGQHNGRPTPIAGEEIEDIKRLMDSDLRLDPFPYLKVGQRARIQSGPLAGVEGLIVRKKKECRLVLTIELLQRSVSVVVNEATLSPIR